MIRWFKQFDCLMYKAWLLCILIELTSLIKIVLMLIFIVLFVLFCFVYHFQSKVATGHFLQIHGLLMPSWCYGCILSSSFCLICICSHTETPVSLHVPVAISLTLTLSLLGHLGSTTIEKDCNNEEKLRRSYVHSQKGVVVANTGARDSF